MKKTLLIVVIVLAVIIALPVISFIRWSFQAKKPLNIILVDKTVPTLERVKHKSFNWTLTNERFVKRENDRSYSYRKDYYGFYPQRPLRDKEWERNDYRLVDLINLAETNDVVYFADTYGIAFNDWYRAFSKSRKTRKIYGGLNNNDYLLISEMKNRNKLIILEYNSFDYPTAQFESVRTQEKLGITFTGWTGKYFASLDTTSADFPTWMTAMYRKQHKMPWTFTKPGLVILGEKDIVVLEEGNNINNAMPHILTESEYCLKYGVPVSVAFDKWFDIIEPLENNVISRFKIETNEIGDSILFANNLMNEFPAVIQEPATNNIYYFAGDFATNSRHIWSSRFIGVSKLKVFLYSDKPDDTRRFFWLYYRPLINGILTDYYNSINSQ